MKIDLPERQRWLMLAAGAGVVLLILNWAVITPLGAAWTAHADEIARLRTSIAEGRGLLARGPHLQQVWSGMRTEALPRDQAQSEHDVIFAFENWSRVSGVELGAVKPQWKQGATPDYSVLECRLDASGSLAALSRFLFELGKAPMALRVEAVELTSRDETGQRLTLGLTVTGLRLYPQEGKS
jgi:hypothetical protein